MTAVVTNICKVCGEPFETSKSYQQSCSPLCRKEIVCVNKLILAAEKKPELADFCKQKLEEIRHRVLDVKAEAEKKRKRREELKGLSREEKTRKRRQWWREDNPEEFAQWLEARKQEEAEEREERQRNIEDWQKKVASGELSVFDEVEGVEFKNSNTFLFNKKGEWLMDYVGDDAIFRAVCCARYLINAKNMSGLDAIRIAGAKYKVDNRTISHYLLQIRTNKQRGYK